MALAVGCPPSSRRPSFDQVPIFVRFVEDKVALGLVYLRVSWFNPVSITLPMHQTHLHVHAVRQDEKC